LSASPPSWTDDEQHLRFDEEPVLMLSLPGQVVMQQVVQRVADVLSASGSDGRAMDCPHNIKVLKVWLNYSAVVETQLTTFSIN